MLDNVIFKFMIWNCIEYPALKHFKILRIWILVILKLRIPI